MPFSSKRSLATTCQGRSGKGVTISGSGLFSLPYIVDPDPGFLYCLRQAAMRTRFICVRTFHHHQL